MKDLIKKVDKLGDDVERLQSLQSGSGGSGVTTATLPLAITGSNIAIAVTVTNDGGAIAKQAASPGSPQTGNINITGKIIAGSTITATGNITGGSMSTSSLTASTIATTSSIQGNTSIQAGTTIQAITGPYYLGSVPILDSGGTFPSSGLLDGQRYYHTTYRSWFMYNSTDAKWRQEAPGVFASSFPTVAVGDNTVAPQMQVTRLDRSNEVYFWDGTRWLSVTRYSLQLIYAVGVTFPASATASSVLRSGAPDNTLAIYIEKMVVRAITNTTLDATNNWTVELWRQDTTGATTQLGTANTFQVGRVAGTPYLNTVTLNTAYSLANIIQLSMTVTKNSAPGTLAFDPAVVWYRLIG